MVLVVFAAQPMAPQKALLSGLMAFAGGLFQTSLSVVSWLHRRTSRNGARWPSLYGGLKQMIDVARRRE